jgi:hypothetical protein
MPISAVAAATWTRFGYRLAADAQGCGKDGRRVANAHAGRRRAAGSAIVEARPAGERSPAAMTHEGRDPDHEVET